MSSLNTASRREFLKRAAALSSLGSAMPFALNLAGIGAASAQTAPDYRALICLFMFGGNDHNNMVVPYDTASYATYQASRVGIEQPYANLTEIVPASSQGAGLRFALPLQMSAVQALFAQGKAAVLANVGPLLAPTKMEDYKAGRNLPPKLFSHNDQQATWQAFSPEGVKVGWCGRMGDLLRSQNADTAFTSISAAGNAVMMSGNSVLQYQVSSAGATKINGATATSLFGSSLGDDAMREMILQGGSNLLEKDHAAIVKRSYDAADKVTAALAKIPDTDVSVALPADLASDNFARQMQIVMRMIASRADLGAKRQVFFVSLGGFDSHDNQLVSQAALLTRVSKVIDYFYQSAVKLGVQNQATLFTASDFGRTLASNGDGSDHGWGSHHFIVGGAVKGGDIYGQFPQARIGNSQDVGGGRWLPTTSVDQYAATLGKWFGVADSDMASITPNIGNFATRYLSFL